MARKTKQQALETRNQILDAAIARFSEFGVSATSLADIATAAGVTRGAIYWHFKNKTDLLNEIWAQSESGLEDVEQEYQSKYPDDPLSLMRATPGSTNAPASASSSARGCRLASVPQLK